MILLTRIFTTYQDTYYLLEWIPTTYWDGYCSLGYYLLEDEMGRGQGAAEAES